MRGARGHCRTLDEIAVDIRLMQVGMKGELVESHQDDAWEFGSFQNSCSDRPVAAGSMRRRRSYVACHLLEARMDSLVQEDMCAVQNRA